MKKSFTGAVTVSFLLLFSAGYSQDEVSEIIRKVDEKAKVTTSVVKMSMQVFPIASDEENFRDMRVLAYGQGDDDSYMEFITPKSIKGLRILSRSGDQWVYFPSTGRVRKIAGKAKKESVKGVGGDFSYEDMSGGSLEEKYTFTLLGSSAQQWQLQGTPKDTESSYSKIILFVRKSNYLVDKIEFYTPEDGHYKDMIQSEVKMISGRETPTRMEMVNLIRNSKTVVLIHDAEYDVKIDEKYFNPMRFYQ